MGPARRLLQRTSTAVLVVVALLAIVGTAGAAAADADDVIAVDTLTTDAYRERRARRKKHGTTPAPVTLSPEDEADMGSDAEAAGESEYGSIAAETRTASFNPGANQQQHQQQQQSGGHHQQQEHQQQQQQHSGSDDSSSGKKESRKEQYARKQREYQEQQQQQQQQQQGSSSGSSSSSSGKPAGPVQSAFPVKLANGTTNLAKRAQHVRDELAHYVDWLAHADRRVEGLRASVDDDALAAMQLEALANLPLPPIPAHELTHIRNAAEQAKRTAKKLRAEAKKATAALANSNAAKALEAAKKHGTTADVTAALAALDDAESTALAALRASLEEHHAMHRALAGSAMASSIVSAGIVKGQLDAADKALAAMRNQDDSGVGNTERKARRAALKQAHRAVKAHVDDFANARRIAHAQAAAARAALDAHTLRTLVFKNALARQAPAAITATTDYTVPMPVRLVGLTSHELMMLLLVTLLPYQVVRLTWFAGTCLGGVIRWARGKKAASKPKHFPGGPGRVLGSTATKAATPTPFYKKKWFVLAINLAASVGASALVIIGMPHVTAPAFAFVSPSTLWFTWRHAVAPLHQVIIAAAVLWGHVLQVWFTV